MLLHHRRQGTSEQLPAGLNDVFNVTETGTCIHLCMLGTTCSINKIYQTFSISYDEHCTLVGWLILQIVKNVFFHGHSTHSENQETILSLVHILHTVYVNFKKSVMFLSFVMQVQTAQLLSHKKKSELIFYLAAVHNQECHNLVTTQFLRIASIGMSYIYCSND
jgi:hypothetical protein